jgi:hypothetical protein
LWCRQVSGLVSKSQMLLSIVMGQSIVHKGQKCKSQTVGKKPSFPHYQNCLCFLKGKVMLGFVRRKSFIGDLIKRNFSQRCEIWMGIKRLAFSCGPGSSCSILA